MCIVSIKYFLPYGIDGGPEGKVGREELEQEHASLEPGMHLSELLAAEAKQQIYIGFEWAQFG